MNVAKHVQLYPTNHNLHALEVFITCLTRNNTWYTETNTSHERSRAIALIQGRHFQGWAGSRGCLQQKKLSLTRTSTWAPCCYSLQTNHNFASVRDAVFRQATFRLLDTTQEKRPRELLLSPAFIPPTSSDMAELVDIPDQLHPKKSHVCDRCLSVWPGVPYQNQGSEIFGIEETAKELLESACEICQILGTELQVHQEQKPSMTKPVLRWNRWYDHSGVAVFYDFDDNIEGHYLTTGMIRVWSSEPSIADDWKNVEIEGGRIDFDSIRGWLDECSKSHDRCKFSTQKEPRNLRVIDCTKRAIVEAPVRCRYVALSYVWGGLSLNIDTNARVLPPGLPRTIEDSIEATLLLGYQYLWVE